MPEQNGWDKAAEEYQKANGADSATSAPKSASSNTGWDKAAEEYQKTNGPTISAQPSFMERVGEKNRHRGEEGHPDFENYTQEGRAEHPILSRVGDITRNLKDYVRLVSTPPLPFLIPGVPESSAKVMETAAPAVKATATAPIRYAARTGEAILNSKLSPVNTAVNMFSRAEEPVMASVKFPGRNLGLPKPVIPEPVIPEIRPNISEGSYPGWRQGTERLPGGELRINQAGKAVRTTPFDAPSGAASKPDLMQPVVPESGGPGPTVISRRVAEGSRILNRPRSALPPVLERGGGISPTIRPILGAAAVAVPALAGAAAYLNTKEEPKKQPIGDEYSVTPIFNPQHFTPQQAVAAAQKARQLEEKNTIPGAPAGAIYGGKNPKTGKYEYFDAKGKSVK